MISVPDLSSIIIKPRFCNDFEISIEFVYIFIQYTKYINACSIEDNANIG